MQLLAGIGRDQMVHEVEELAATFARVMPQPHLTGRGFQRRKEGRGPMADIFVTEPGERPPVGQLQPALLPLQRLNRGLLVDAQHQRVLRWIQIQADDIRRLRRKLRVGRNAKATPPGQTDAVLPQDPPDGIVTHVAEMLGQHAAVPTRKAGGRRPIQRGQNAALRLRVVAGRLARPRRILQPDHPRLRKAGPPLPGHRLAASHTHSDRLVAQAFGGQQHNPRAQHESLFGRAGARQPRQLVLLFWIQLDSRGNTRHAPCFISLTVYCKYAVALCSRNDAFSEVGLSKRGDGLSLALCRPVGEAMFLFS